METDAADLGALEKALNDNAGNASVLWTTLVTFEIYLAIGFGAVTNRDLFLGTPVRLPILNIDLPLVGFFVVAPAVLVVFHFYVLTQLYGLAVKIGEYGKLLDRQLRFNTDRELLRQRLDSFLIVQFLAGSKEIRNGIQGASLRMITWITLVGAPVLILLQAQLTFLAYHLQWVTWSHRTLLIVDLIVIWAFWSRIRKKGVSTYRRVLRLFWRITGLVAGLALTASIVAFSVGVATFPGEWTDTRRPALIIIPKFQLRWPELGRLEWSNSGNWVSVYDWFFAGAVDEITGKPTSLLSNRLVLTDQSFVDQDKLAKDVSISLRGRDLRGAVFNRADLRKSDFIGAMLNEASFTEAKLDGAKFDCASRNDERKLPTPFGLDAKPKLEYWPDDGCTWLQGATLEWAKLGGGVTFWKSHLEGSSFDFAHMEGVNLNYAHLQGAGFFQARLQGASFTHAQLQGGSLRGAALQGADFFSTEMRGADLDYAQLEGANLDFANLQGASLRNARLQGTSIQFIHLESALLVEAEVWRAAAGDAAGVGQQTLYGAVVNQLNCRQRPWDSTGHEKGTSFDLWLKASLLDIPEGDQKEKARGRLLILDPKRPDPAGLLANEIKCAKALPTDDFIKALYANDESLTGILLEIGCSPQSAPYVLRGMLKNGDFSEPRARLGSGAQRLLGAEADRNLCPGATDFTDFDWSTLKWWVHPYTGDKQ